MNYTQIAKASYIKCKEAGGTMSYKEWSAIIIPKLMMNKVVKRGGTGY